MLGLFGVQLIVVALAMVLPLALSTRFVGALIATASLALAERLYLRLRCSES